MFLFFSPLLHCLIALRPKSQLRHLNTHTYSFPCLRRLQSLQGGSVPHRYLHRRVSTSTSLKSQSFLLSSQHSHAPDEQAFQHCQFPVGNAFHSCLKCRSVALLPRQAFPVHKLSAMVTGTVVYHLAANFAYSNDYFGPGV